MIIVIHPIASPRLSPLQVVKLLYQRHWNCLNHLLRIELNHDMGALYLKSKVHIIGRSIHKVPIPCPRQHEDYLPCSSIRLGHLLNQLGDGTRGIESLGTHPGAVHDLMASVQLVLVIQRLHPLLGEVVPGIAHPAVGLHKHCRSQVLL